MGKVFRKERHLPWHYLIADARERIRESQVEENAGENEPNEANE
jgi:hypothetical protein